MEINAHFKSKLSNLLFLEIEKNRGTSIFKTNINEDIYIPIATDSIIQKVKNGETVEKIPIGFFVEGMFFVLGADEEFRYNETYKELINNVPKSIEFIKGRIAEKVKNNNYEDAYIMLKGLNVIEKNKEIYDKLIMLLQNLKELNKSYVDEELKIIDEAKLIEDYANPYLYEAFIKRDKGDYDGALFSINTYIAKGGEETVEITEFKNSLKTVTNYDKAKKLVYEEPEKALAILIPLTRELGDNAEIYYHIAVGYRILENHDKAIYYLEKSLEIDSSYPEVFNELGINYASLENFESAIQYFRKVFEATKSIEVCTNLVMCYLNIGDNKQAKIHLEIAKKIDAKDEIVIQLEKMMKDF
ncbi:tetratricopeptide repeat protein [Clostridium ganghwense]|uniref:Tetratricopeptide repeat protein n=1 Tax=Clostridium ganghwense TaxID=312089 RepID=A0ABT4CN95_9CLOT|nr:tetratricopeptide repeat protein [Clostridium ganghwense]MCY6370517.1 tetratricopeptide repeat protein [Clostridium ganghwense]